MLDLISTRVSYVVQESIVVIKDIFRRYPQRYEGIIPTLCASLDELDEPEAKASLIWILGEYADKIENADELIGSFLDTYADEPVQVQLQALTAVVKLFLHRPEQAQALVQRVLALATKTADSADLRDRAYIQWRLLSSDTEVAKAVILASRPPISLPTTSVPPALLDELISELGALSAAYHKCAALLCAHSRIKRLTTVSTTGLCRHSLPAASLAPTRSRRASGRMATTSKARWQPWRLDRRPRMCVKPADVPLV